MAQEKHDNGTNCWAAFVLLLHSHTTSMQTTADYCCRPLGSNDQRTASTSRWAWGLGAGNMGSPQTSKYTAATVGTYGASTSMKPTWRIAVAPVLCPDHAKRAPGGAEASLQGCTASLPYLTTYTPP